MQETRMVKANTPGNPFQRGQQEDQTRWEDYVKKGIQKLKLETLVQDRRIWKELVEKAKTLH
jgi:hypothetical protein